MVHLYIITVYMKQKLTDQQLKFFSCLVGYIQLVGCPPTVRQMLSSMGLKSPRSVSQYYDALEKAGFIRRGKGARNIQILKKPFVSNTNGDTKTVPVPIVGVVACGTPLLAEESLEGRFAVSVNLAKPPYQYFILRAKGDSMNKAGIDDGDLVLIRQQSTANNGDIVVALIDDEATIKQFQRMTGAISLNPISSNPTHCPIVLERDFQVQGVVVEVLDNVKGNNGKYPESDTN